MSGTWSIRPVLLPLILALTMTLGWAALAQAQDGPTDAQYGNKAASGEMAVAAADVNPNGSGGSNSNSGDSGSGPVAALTSLPDTGGALFPFMALGIFVLSAAGLLVMRRGEGR